MADLEQHIAAVRHFNRFYTRQIGVLQEGLVQSPFSLTEVRVLYELAHREQPTATELGQALGLDAGYLSRILRAFEERGLVARRTSERDGRQSLLALTRAGRKVFAGLDARTRQEVDALLQPLGAAAQQRLVAAMRAIEGVLAPSPSTAPYLLRPHQPGDMGWVVQRHGAIYAEEYGFDARFEALVASVVSEFLTRFDPRRERAWIAERDGANVGSVLVVAKSATVAQLRLLLVEPSARGLGLGKRLVSECTRFARQTGYRKLALWTNDILHAARHVYEQEGYRLVAEEPHDGFGPATRAQTWELAL